MKILNKYLRVDIITQQFTKLFKKIASHWLETEGFIVFLFSQFNGMVYAPDGTSKIFEI